MVAGSRGTTPFAGRLRTRNSSNSRPPSQHAPGALGTFLPARLYCRSAIMGISDRRRNKFRKFQTSTHEQNKYKYSRASCASWPDVPPLPPQFQCWTVEKLVHELAKFLPLQRPPWRYGAEAYAPTLKLGGAGGPGLLSLSPCLRCAHLTCEISSVTSHPPKRGSPGSKHTCAQICADVQFGNFRNDNKSTTIQNDSRLTAMPKNPDLQQCPRIQAYNTAQESRLTARPKNRNLA